MIHGVVQLRYMAGEKLRGVVFVLLFLQLLLLINFLLQSDGVTIITLDLSFKFCRDLFFLLLAGLVQSHLNVRFILQINALGNSLFDVLREFL